MFPNSWYSNRVLQEVKRVPNSTHRDPGQVPCGCRRAAAQLPHSCRTAAAQLPYRCRVSGRLLISGWNRIQSVAICLLLHIRRCPGSEMCAPASTFATFSKHALTLKRFAYFRPKVTTVTHFSTPRPARAKSSDYLKCVTVFTFEHSVFISVVTFGWNRTQSVAVCLLLVSLGPQEAPGGLRRPQEAPGSPRRPQETPGGPRRPQEGPGGPRRPQDFPPPMLVGGGFLATPQVLGRRGCRELLRVFALPEASVTARGSHGRQREATGTPGEPREAPGSHGKPREAP